MESQAESSQLPTALQGAEVPHDSLTEIVAKLGTLSLANAQLPINRLPSEVLLEVLLAARDSMDDHRQPWHELLLVCKLWYELSTDFPVFWAHLKITHNRQITASRLRLSKNAPLSVYHRRDGMSYRVEMDEFANTLGAEVNRVETFVYRGWGLSDKLEKIIPAVKTLDMTFLVAPYRGAGPLRLPPNASLRNLFLDQVDLDYSSLCLRNLVRLSLCRMYNCPPSLSDIVRIIEASPGLNLLHLQGISRSGVNSEDTAKTISPISLPYLGQLVLREIPDSISEALLRSLVPEQICCLILEQVDLGEMAPFIRQAFSHLEISRLYVEAIVCDHRGPAKGRLVKMIIAPKVAPRLRVQAMPKQLGVALKIALDQLRASNPSLLVDLQFAADPDSVNVKLESWLSPDIIGHLGNIRSISVGPQLDGSSLVDNLGTQDLRAKHCSKLESLFVDGKENI